MITGLETPQVGDLLVSDVTHTTAEITWSIQEDGKGFEPILHYIIKVSPQNDVESLNDEDDSNVIDIPPPPIPTVPVSLEWISSTGSQLEQNDGGDSNEQDDANEHSYTTAGKIYMVT